MENAVIYWWIILYSSQVYLSVSLNTQQRSCCALSESNQTTSECNESRSERHNSSQNKKQATSYTEILTYQRAIKCFTFIVCSYPEYGIRVNCDIQRMNKIFVLVAHKSRTKREETKNRPNRKKKKRRRFRKRLENIYPNDVIRAVCIDLLFICLSHLNVRLKSETLLESFLSR